MLRVLIVDDKADARELVQNSLATFCPNVQLVGTAKSVKSGIETIGKFKPDIVLLDV